MAEIQTRDAIRLLSLVVKAVTDGELLTYSGAALAMNRTPPQDHAKAVAQMCDLLDAAACLAGVPLLALVAVREKSGEINPKAWKKEYGPRRDAIIARSEGYVFGQKDFTAVRSAIDDLGGRGNTKAWQYLQSVYPATFYFGASLASTRFPNRTRSMTWGLIFPLGSFRNHGAIHAIPRYGMPCSHAQRGVASSAALKDS